MDFFIVELSGRHHRFTGANETTTVGDARRFICMQSLGEALESALTRVKIHLIHQGTLLTDDNVTLSSLGLNSETSESFRLHCVFKPLPSRILFDGNCHPVVINGVPIGGDLKNQQTEIEYSRNTFLSLISQSDSISTATETPIERSLLVNQEAVQAMNDFISQQGVATSNFKIPTCLFDFLTCQGISELCMEKLPFNPLVLTDRSMDWGAPFLVLPTETVRRAAMLFMMDHQGCCYWYAVWTLSDSSDKVILDDCEVYVLIGGEEFIWGETVYPTSRHFWKFLIEFVQIDC
jgi:hypothetical protein